MAAIPPTSGQSFLVVRSVVQDAAMRPRFDHWYGTDHAPKAGTMLGANRAWRFWSLSDESVHYAVYEFASEAKLRAAMASSAVPALMAEYDATWPAGVSRTRELIVEASLPRWPA